MGIEVAGDPFWFDHLDRDRRRAVLGLMVAEAEDLPATAKPDVAKRAPDAVVVPAHADEHGTPEAYGRLAEILGSEP